MTGNWLTALAAALLLAAPAASRPSVGAPADAPARLVSARLQQPGGRAVPSPDLAALQLQVMLDRAGFSPGVIDGQMGANTERALALYQQHRGDGTPAGDMLSLASYTITEADTAGPFTPEIPADLVEQAALPALGYRSVLEALAERFHATPELLKGLNPGAAFAAGDTVQVPNVEPFAPPHETVHVNRQGQVVDPSAPRTVGTAGRRGADAPAAPPVDSTLMSRPDVVVTVSEAASRLTVTDSGGQIIFSAPVTTGSNNDPLPIGEWTITGVQINPVFHYNPALFWDAKPTDAKARLAPGPNNPVGVAWIDLDKEHYGIHGTPEPAAIGRAQSHGCVRLTNWDVMRLAALVKPGTRVHFVN